MNIPLAREIYGQPWLIDSVSLQGLTAALAHFKKGGNVTVENKANSTHLYDIEAKTFVSDRVYEVKENADKETVAVTRLDGAITKNGGKSSYGTTQIAAKMRKLDSFKNVVGHVLVIDSGGGSVVAVKYMKDAIKGIKKPVVASIEDLGASAAYDIATETDHIMAQNADTLVGSIGVMVEFQGTPKVADNKETGERSVRIYADQSTDKNLEFEEAINNLNFTPVKENRLNPIAARFIESVKAKRPNVTEEHLKGGVFEAGKVVGTLIDSIGSFDAAVNKVKQLSGRSGSINSNLNNNQMTKQELQAEHPAVYEAIQVEERNRVEAILAFADVDLQACQAMVASGETPGPKFFAEMARKETAKLQLQHIESESAEEIEIDAAKEVETPVEKQDTKKSDFDKRMRAAAGLKVEGVKS